MSDIGERIKHARQIKGMSQETLARAIGSTKSTISKYELGHREPSLDTIQRIADALRIEFFDLVVPTGDQASVDELLTEVEDAKKRGLRVVWKNDNLYLTAPSKEQKILLAFGKLNAKGREVAVERVEELAKIPEYQRKPGDGEDE